MEALILLVLPIPLMAAAVALEHFDEPARAPHVTWRERLPRGAGRPDRRRRRFGRR
jgi:hypothetical protein